MTSEYPFHALKIIWNPAAGGYRGEQRWNDLKGELDSKQIPYDVRKTEYPGHATEIIRDWIKGKVDRIGIVGGDGTFNEAINGVFKDGKNLKPNSVWLYLAAGSSCDFEKKFNSGRSSMEKILSDEINQIDIGKIELENDNQETTLHYFANNSSIGVISQANDIFNSMSGPSLWLKRLSVDGAAILAGLQAIKEHIPSEVKLTLDDEPGIQTRFSNLTVFKTAYFGGGMYYGQSPDQDDGKLAIAWIDGVKRRRLLRLIPALYTGNVLTFPEAHYEEIQSLAVSTATPMVVEADGQVAGTTPVRYNVLPNALKIVA